MRKNNNTTSESMRRAGERLRGPLTIDMNQVADEEYSNMKIKEIHFKADMNDDFGDLILSAAEYIIAASPTTEDVKKLLKLFVNNVPKHRELILKEDPNAFSEESLKKRFELASTMEFVRTQNNR